MSSRVPFRDLVDVTALQQLTDDLYAATGIPSAIIGMDGGILTGSGWQRICTDFHRTHPEIERDCIASDTAIRK
ncbi:MAG: PocR ligand-binding domain-containing protein, partial [Proteobacteria bacterium]|nr:PocR ligand-binding domain-containing protein [Pseudomonadota bacterium]